MARPVWRFGQKNQGLPRPNIERHNPHKSFCAIAKAGATRWKSNSESIARCYSVGTKVSAGCQRVEELNSRPTQDVDRTTPTLNEGCGQRRIFIKRVIDPQVNQPVVTFNSGANVGERRISNHGITGLNGALFRNGMTNLCETSTSSLH